MADYTTEIRNLRSELDGVAGKFNKELNEGMKKLGSLSKSADDLGKSMGDLVDPASMLNKAMGETSARQSALQTQAQNYRQVQQKGISDIFAINELIKERNALDAKQKGGAALTATEQLRLQKLQLDNLESQRRTVGQLANEASRKARASEDEAKSLGKQSSQLEKIQSIYMTIMSLGEKYDKMLSEEAKAQGTTKDEINKQYETIQKMNKSLANNSASNQEILKAVTAVRKEYVMTDSQLASVGKEAANISRLTGLSVDEAAKFQNTLAEVGGTSHMAQENMAAIASKAAEAAGVPMGMVMKDVANASGAVRTIFKGNTVELIKQAAEARKLGTSLDSAAKSAESLLNFESSIGAELKASALLGQNLNFNESRRLAFAGDLLGAEKALQKELEKVGDLDKLNYNQRKALAEVTGKDFSELQKIQTQKKNLLEAEKMFPEETKKMKKAEEELKALQKGGADARKNELEQLIKTKTAEAESAKLAQAKEQALLNLGKALKPVYDLVNQVQIGFFKLLGIITNIGGSSDLGKWASTSVTVILGLVLAFYTLKYGISKVLEFLGNAFATAVEKTGEGVGRGLKAMSGGLTALGTSMATVSPAMLAKLAVILILLTGAAIGLGYAFSMLGKTSASQILAFTAALVILGAGLLGVALLMTPPSPLGAGLLIFAGALAITALAAIGFAKAIQMVTPALDKIGAIFIGLGLIVAVVIKEAFQTMYNIFLKLPEVIGGVAGPLIKLAMVAPLLFVAAGGVGALTLSLATLGAALLLFPTRELTRVTTQLSLLAMSAVGIKAAVSSLKELGDIKLPKIEFGGVAALAAVAAIGSATKKEGSQELKQGLEVVAQKIEVLTYMMANGGIKVNLDGRQVNYALANSANNRGSLGQATF